MHLPEDFTKHTREIMGDELFATLLSALGQKPPVSIRINPWKWDGRTKDASMYKEDVAWCPFGLYLHERPNFTLDPMLHAGAYYVQEASSMFVDHVLRQYAKEPVRMLDLCAAPGGKSTCASSALPAGSVLYSNEPIRNRAHILSENMQKWLNGTKDINGVPTVTVTNNYPKDYQKAAMLFDIIVADAPCSGEGMFRKDTKAISEWSLRHVAECQKLQREIVSDVWPCLRPGGIMVYSTCTFNTHENEENVQWICNELGAEVLPVGCDPSWNITGSLLKGFHEPVYRFIPGKTQGEGLFVAVIKKHGSRDTDAPRSNGKPLNIIEPTFLNELNESRNKPMVNIGYGQAISYLRREAIILPPETPRGIVVVAYQGHPLGLAKNIGNRANNLYPKEWRIKTTHIGTEPYTAISQLST